MSKKYHCKHEIQDEFCWNHSVFDDKGNQVYNLITKNKGWYCTVCEKIVLVDKQKEMRND